MTAQILQFTPHNVAAARAELLTTARAVLADWQHHAPQDILAACEYLKKSPVHEDRVQAGVVRRRTLRIETDRRSLIAERMRDQDAAARMAFTLPPRRDWSAIIGGAVGFVVAWYTVLAVVML